MKRTLWRTLTSVAAIAIGATALAGCTAGDDSSDPNTITIFAPQGETQKLSTNLAITTIEKKFGVHLRFQTTTVDGSAEKRQISLASGDYPDAYWLIPYADRFSQAQLLKLGSQGVLVKMNDLIKSDGPHIQAAMKETPELKNLATSPDGSIWGMPQWNDCFHCSYSYKLWMNTAWLKKLGLSQPTTPAELEKVLEAFKTRDPNGNGKADEIPLTDSVGNSPLPYLMDPFIYTPLSDPTGAQPGSLALHDGKVTLQPTRDGWREGLKYVHELWEKGLIDDSAFSQNTAAMQAKANNASVNITGSFIGQWVGIFVNLGEESQPDGRDKQIDAIPPLKGPNGSPASYQLPSFPGASFVITSKASPEKQKKLMQILDWMYTRDGQLLAQFGKEGVNWEKPSSGDVALDPDEKPIYKPLTPSQDDKQAQNNALGSLGQFYGPMSWRGAQAVPEDIYSPEGLERRLFEATEPYAADKDDDAVFPYWNVWVTSDQASDLATAQTNVESYVAQQSAQFISGTLDINSDAAWQQFQDGLKSNGADTYVSIYQKAYTASKKNN